MIYGISWPISDDILYGQEMNRFIYSIRRRKIKCFWDTFIYLFVFLSLARFWKMKLLYFHLVVSGTQLDSDTTYYFLMGRIDNVTNRPDWNGDVKQFFFLILEVYLWRVFFFFYVTGLCHWSWFVENFFL